MSSAMPDAFWSAISTTTTSASCFSATPRATVAPTFPAPPTTVTLRFIGSHSSGFGLQASGFGPRLESGAWSLTPLHVLDQQVPELRRAHLGGIVHQPGEIIRDVL